MNPLMDCTDWVGSAEYNRALQIHYLPAGGDTHARVGAAYMDWRTRTALERLNSQPLTVSETIAG